MMLGGPKVRRIKFTQSVVGDQVNFRPGQVADVERVAAGLYLKSGAAVAADSDALTVWPHVARPQCCRSCGSDILAVDGSTESWFCCACQSWA